MIDSPTVHSRKDQDFEAVCATLFVHACRESPGHKIPFETLPDTRRRIAANDFRRYYIVGMKAVSMPDTYNIDKDN